MPDITTSPCGLTIVLGLAFLVAAGALLPTHSSPPPDGLALVLPGDASFMQVNSSTSLSPESITVEAWVRPTEFITNEIAIAGKWSDIGENERSYLLWIVNGRFEFVISQFGTNFPKVIATTEPVIGEWMHVAGTFSNETRHRIYINGQEEAMGPANEVLHTNTEPFFVGRVDAGNNEPDYFAGLIDEVRVWNIARTQQQIADAMSDTLSSNDRDGLVGYWRFEALEDLGQGFVSENDIRDLSGNGNHGDLVGSATIGTDVGGGNRAPVANDDVSIAREDVQLNQVLAFFLPLANDFDPDGDPLSVVGFSQAGSGDISFDEGPKRFTYTWNGGSTSDSFTYTISDGEATSSATEYILVDCGCILDDGPVNTQVCPIFGKADRSSSDASLSVAKGAVTPSAIQEDSLDADLFRRFRDEVLLETPVGERYVDHYYDSMPELIWQIVIGNADLLRDRTVAMSLLLQPTIRDLLDGDGSELITQTQVDSINAVFSAVAAVGSDSLQALIAGEFERLGPLENYVGRTVADVLSEVLGAPVGSPTSVDDDALSDRFALRPAAPNPFQSSTRIAVEWDKPEALTLEIFDVGGRTIKTLLRDARVSSRTVLSWDGSTDVGTPVPSGLYLVRLRSETEQETRKIILQR